MINLTMLFVIELFVKFIEKSKKRRKKVHNSVDHHVCDIKQLQGLTLEKLDLWVWCFCFGERKRNCSFLINLNHFMVLSLLWRRPQSAVWWHRARAGHSESMQRSEQVPQTQNKILPVNIIPKCSGFHTDAKHWHPEISSENAFAHNFTLYLHRWYVYS